MTIKAGTGLRLTAMPFFGLVLSPLERILFLALNRIADLGRNEAADAF